MSSYHIRVERVEERNGGGGVERREGWEGVLTIAARDDEDDRLEDERQRDDANETTPYHSDSKNGIQK